MWGDRTIQITNKLRTSIDPLEDPLEGILGMAEPNYIILAIHAEIILKIRSLGQETNYLTLPKVLIKRAVEKIQKSERKTEFKSLVDTLFPNG